MIRTVIGGVEVQDYIVDGGYDIRIQPVLGEHSFWDTEGKLAEEMKGGMVILKLSMEAPTFAAFAIAQVLQRASFEVEYTTPAPAVNKFKCADYHANCSYADPDENDHNVTSGIVWEINITLESVELIAGDEAGGL